MTTDRLEDIRARLLEATPGPWDAPFSSYVMSRNREARGKVCQLGDPWITNRNQVGDAQFIAHAREDLPWCVEEIERLRGELARQDPKVFAEAVARELARKINAGPNFSGDIF